MLLWIFSDRITSGFIISTVTALLLLLTLCLTPPPFPAWITNISKRHRSSCNLLLLPLI